MYNFAHHTTEHTNETNLPLLIGSMVVVLIITIVIVALYKRKADKTDGVDQ